MYHTTGGCQGLKTIRPILFIAFIIAICPGAWGQLQTDSTYRYPELVISVKRPLQDKGVTKTSFDTLLLQDKLNASIAELISNYSPVFIKSYGQGSLATASFRGTAASHTKVEWNGIAINSPMLGQVDFSLIPIFFADDVSLLHGGSSLQKGSGALGGSVHIDTRPQWSKKIYGSYVMGLSSFQTNQHFISVGGGSKKLQVRMRYYHEQSENNFRFFNNANGLWNYERQQNAEYEKNSLLGEVHLNAGNNHFISVNVWGQIADRNLPPIMSYEGTGREEHQKDNEFRIVGKWNKYGKKIKSSFTTGTAHTDLDYFRANNTGYGLLIHYDTRNTANSYYNKYLLEYSPSVRLLIKTLVNYNFHRVSIYNQADFTGYHKDRNESGASIGFHYSLKNNLSAFLLVREEYVDHRFTPLMPSTGIEWQPFKRFPVNVRANFTRNYHQPTLNDLYWIPGGNPDLKPEEGYTADLGMDYILAVESLFKLTTGLTGYMSYINDWIIWQPGAFRDWTAENLKTVFARGIEYNLNAAYNRQKWSFAFIGNYTYTRTTNEGMASGGDHSKGKQLIYVPLHKANSLLHAEYDRFYLCYNFNFLSERFTTSDNEDTRHRLPAFCLHQISAGKRYTVGKLSGEIQFKVNNLTDKNYQAILWRAMPGRHYAFFVKLSF